MDITVPSVAGDKLVFEYQTYGHFQGILETNVFDVYKSCIVEEGEAVIDLGAGIGDFSIVAGKLVGNTGIVLAVEPSPRNFALMLRNIKKNNLKNIIAVNSAISNKIERRNIQWEDESYESQTTTLSELMKAHEIRVPDTIKMDIEGVELEVIKDALDILRRVKNIPIELHGTKNVIDDLLKPLGFNFVPFIQSTLRKNILKYGIKHPGILYSLYRRYKFLNGKRSPIETLFSGTEITNIGSYVTGVYKNSNRE